MASRTPFLQDPGATARGAEAEDLEPEQVEAVDEETVRAPAVLVEEGGEAEVKVMEIRLLPNPQMKLRRANYRRSRSSLSPGRATMMKRLRSASSAPTQSSITRLRLATMRHAIFAHCD